MKFNTNGLFEPGKITICMDASAGSSGKGKIASFIAKHADNWQFCCNAFSAQAGHWVVDDVGKFFYQTFNSCAYLDKYEKMYVGPGSAIELEALFREIEESSIKPYKIGIHPLATIIQEKDAAFERGEVDLDGNPIRKHDGTMKTGSTCHGVGACRARRVLRRPDLLLARDIPELKEFICDTTEEIIERLNKGQAGLLEIAQGFQLSIMLPSMYPYCTSRNVTVAAALDDMMLPVIYAGNVILNCRTYPIRINSNKYRDRDTGEHLIWDQVEEYKNKGKLEIYKGNSGPGYGDQKEITWEELTEWSGSPEPIVEMTSVTKLPRRVFTFSKSNLEQAITYNRTPGRTSISINFANYVDHTMSGRRGMVWFPAVSGDNVTRKFINWLKENVYPVANKTRSLVQFIGTGPHTDDMIIMEG
jgi:adenylosuccinate synthase